MKAALSNKDNQKGDIVMKTIAEREKQLRDRLAYLAANMQKIEGELDHSLDKDIEDAAIDIEDDEVLEDLGNSEKLETRQIEAALQRIVEGEYGYCVECGDKIAEERLDVLPQTPFCAKCAANHD